MTGDRDPLLDAYNRLCDLIERMKVGREIREAFINERRTEQGLPPIGEDDVTGDRDPRSDPPEEWRVCLACDAINPWRPQGCGPDCLKEEA